MWKTLPVIVTLAASSLAPCADRILELKYSEDVLAELERRGDFFEAEMASGAVPDWAGLYYDGVERGRNPTVRIAPQGGFIFTRSGCFGLYDINYGPVELRGGRLLLTFELPNDPGRSGGPGSLVPVRWGERNYLLAEEDLKPFVNAVNSGNEPQKACVPSCGSFLLREGDAEKQVSGLPELPAEYRRLLLDRPITGHVMRNLDTETRMYPDSSFGTRTTRVEIDVGSDDGVWIGMELYADENPYPGSGFEVVQTYGRSSVAVKRDFVISGEPPLESGICISTRPGEQTCPIEQTAALR